MLPSEISQYYLPVSVPRPPSARTLLYQPRVYGGAEVGLMGALADATLAAGGEAVGVMPDALVAKEIAHRGLTELRVTGSMHVTKDQFRLDVGLGFLLTPLKSTIEKEIHAQLDRMLGESGKATKSTKA